MKKGLLLFTASLTTMLISSAFAADPVDTEKKLVPTQTPVKQTTKPVSKDAPAAEPEKTWIDNFSATMDFTNNYVFRGVTQTENLPAVQGGFTYTFPVGFYLNAWGSNVKFPDTNATIELDTVAGWSGEVGDFAYNVSAARYNYPQARDLNYNELLSVFNYSFLQASLNYSGNVYNTHQTGIYYNGGINYDVPPNYVFGVENVNVQALMGHYSLPRAAGNSYNDYLLGISKAIKNYTLSLQWTNTNGRQHNTPYDDAQVIGMVTASIPE